MIDDLSEMLGAYRGYASAGELLDAYMVKYKLTNQTMSEHLDNGATLVGKMRTGSCRITSISAAKLQYVTGIHSSIWLLLSVKQDLRHARTAPLSGLEFKVRSDDSTRRVFKWAVVNNQETCFTDYVELISGMYETEQDAQAAVDGVYSFKEHMFKVVCLEGSGIPKNEFNRIPK